MTASQIPVLFPLSERPLSLRYAEPLPAEADTIHLHSTSPDGSPPKCCSETMQSSLLFSTITPIPGPRQFCGRPSRTLLAAGRPKILLCDVGAVLFGAGDAPW